MQRSHRRVLSFALLLVVAGLLLHWGAWRYPFVDYDDPDYVSNNAVVSRGLSVEGFQWAFGARAANWHPLTWISHMLDVELYGLDAGGHHFGNILLHALNAALLFLAFWTATSRTAASFCLAMLYLLHPLQVESTLWISERKDLLSAFFALACLWAYVGARRRSSPWLGRAAVGLLLLGLLSKPMLVSWPFVLLLVDRWPLRRSEPWSRLLLEKWVMFVAAALVAALTVWAQRSGGSVGSTELLPMSARLSNALVAYARYLFHYSWWPGSLSVAYPHPALVPAWGGWGAARVAGSAALLSALGILAWRSRNASLRVGLAWFAGMLVPVIGLVQVGPQSLADRYMLLPSIGLGIAVCFAPRWRSRELATLLGLAVFAGMSWRSHAQGRLWASSETLFRHAALQGEHNWQAWAYLGNALRDRGAQLEAVEAYDRSLAIQPSHAAAQFNRGNALQDLRRLQEAEQAYRACLAVDPEHAGAITNLGLVMLATGRPQEAAPLLERALRLDPADPGRRLNLALVLHGLGRFDESLRVLEQAEPSIWERAAPQLRQRAQALRERLRAEALAP